MAAISRHSRVSRASVNRLMNAFLGTSGPQPNPAINPSSRHASVLVFNHDSISKSSPTFYKWQRAFQSTDSTKSEDESQAAAEMSENEKKLTEEVATLKEKHGDIMDKYRRSLAENENMRKRLTKQIEDAKVFGI